MQLHAENTYSQTANVNLNGSSLTLQELISEIENQTGYLFIYSKQDVDLNQKLKVKTVGKTVADILNKAFKGTELNYKFTNNYIYSNSILLSSCSSIFLFLKSSRLKQSILLSFCLFGTLVLSIFIP